jgi:uncharacterized protein
MFSILFGASMILVIERAEASGRGGWNVHLPRMLVLLLFGLAHFYLLWWGDILANYALVGLFAFVFWRFDAIPLVFIAALVFAGYYAPGAYERLQALSHAELTALTDAWSPYRATAQEIAQDAAAHASIAAHVRATVTDPNVALQPIGSVFSYGFETLGLMLLGMAGYKSGFLTGAWSRRAYAVIATMLIGASLGLFGYAAWRILSADFDPQVYVPWYQVYVTPMHSLSAIGYMALIMLIFRGRGTVADRFAAVGRAAFSNYIGSTLIGTLVFFGTFGGLYGELSRGETWLIVPPTWALMLLWSKWWLDRFRYGPFEWAWRALARWGWQPMRRAAG